MRKSNAEYQKEYRARKKAAQSQTKALPNYGLVQGAAQAITSDNVIVAGEQPYTRNARALNIAEWEDEIITIDHDGYQRMLRNPALCETVKKKACRVVKLNWTAVGQEDRAEYIKNCFDQSLSLVDAIEFLLWGEVEGWRACQMIKFECGPYNVADFKYGGIRKFNAGGTCQWDGKHLVRAEDSSALEFRPAKKLRGKNFLIHRPGAGSSPEGETGFGVAVYKIIEKLDQAYRNTSAHAELYGLPSRVFHGEASEMQPTKYRSAIDKAKAKIERLKGGDDLFLSPEAKITLLEPQGRTFEDMLTYINYLEGLIDQMFLGNTLTSKTNEAERTGNTEVHKDEENDMIFMSAMQLAETFNRYYIPWIVEKNPEMPALREGEREVYLWPSSPEEDDDQDIDVEQEDGEDPNNPDVNTEDPENPETQDEENPDGEDE